jgi:hypothetical protein
MRQAAGSSRLVLTGNPWSLAGYPSPEDAWSEREKIRFFAEEGYEAVTMGGRPGLGKWLRDEAGLRLCGFFQATTLKDLEPLYLAQVEAGAETINCFLGTPATSLDEGIGLFAELDRLERACGIAVHAETHRATMLESPEFSFALYQASHSRSGHLPRLCHDDSHISVVKHLPLRQLAEFLTTNRNEALLQRSHQMHLRPFNAHHAQVPVLDATGRETREFRDWLEYVRPVTRAWQDARESAGDLWVVPELGPVVDGYGLSTGADVLEELRHCAMRIRELFPGPTRDSTPPLSA